MVEIKRGKGWLEFKWDKSRKRESINLPRLKNRYERRRKLLGLSKRQQKKR